LTPFNLAFYEFTESIFWYVVFNYTIDFLFLIDIIVIFNTAFTNDAFEVVDNRKLIAINYIQGWFTIDLLAIVPFDLITELLSSNGDDSTSNVN